MNLDREAFQWWNERELNVSLSLIKRERPSVDNPLLVSMPWGPARVIDDVGDSYFDARLVPSARNRPSIADFLSNNRLRKRQEAKDQERQLDQQRQLIKAFHKVHYWTMINYGLCLTVIMVYNQEHAVVYVGKRSHAAFYTMQGEGPDHYMINNRPLPHRWYVWFNKEKPSARMAEMFCLS